MLPSLDSPCINASQITHLYLYQEYSLPLGRHFRALILNHTLHLLPHLPVHELLIPVLPASRYQRAPPVLLVPLVLPLVDRPVLPTEHPSSVLAALLQLSLVAIPVTV